MYKFYILKTSYWNSEYSILEKFSTKNIIKGITKTVKNMQAYINNHTVNDYTSFSMGYMEYNGKYYHVSGKNKLQYDKTITAI
jgi:hypothetical protein